MYDTNGSTPRKITRANQGHRPVEVVSQCKPVGIVAHSGGTLRLFEDPHTGGLYAEVIGFTTDAGRRFLDKLHGLDDIASDILVCDRPDEYMLDAVPLREYHVRRRSS